VAGPKSPYQGLERAKARLRGRVPLLDLRTDWDDAAEYGWFAFRLGWTPDQVDALPLWLRRRYRRMGGEWDKMLRGE
jgi:hypothetical protein